MNASMRLLKLKKAVQHIEQAVKLIQEVANDGDHKTNNLKSDAQYFQHNLSEFLSCDHNEAGMKVFIERLTGNWTGPTSS